LKAPAPECEKVKSIIEQLENLEREIARIDVQRRSPASEQVAQVSVQLLELLIDVLATGDVNMRRAAAYGLSKMRDPRCLPALGEALNDPDETVRLWAVEGLASLDHPSAVAALVQALGDDSVYVYYSALSALRNARGDLVWRLVVDELEAAPPYMKKRLIKLLGDRAERQAIDALMELLRSSDAGVRYEAVEALRKIGDRRSVDALIECLGDESHDVRCAAIQALRWMGDLRAVEPLVLICLENQDLRLLAVQAVREIAGDECIGPVIQAMHQTRELVKATACEVLRLSKGSS